jgi:hypothetical protein
LFSSHQSHPYIEETFLAIPFIMKPTSLILFAAHAVQAVELSWYLGASCTGAQLYSLKYEKQAAGCTRFPEEAVNAQSLVLDFKIKHHSASVRLFKDKNCEHLIEEEGSSSVCVANENDQVQAYEIVYFGDKRATPIAKRSPEVIQRGIDVLVGNFGLDLVQRDEVSELAPAKQYNIDVANLNANHPFISATAFAITSGLSFGSLVTGCIGVENASPIASASCGMSLAATGISFIATLYHVYKGIQDIKAVLKNNNIQLGNRPAKRGVGEETMTLSHEEYMEYILDLVGVQSKHIGYHQRYEHIDMKTPVYHFSINDGEDFVFTISADENGEVKHSISFAHEARVHRRQGYEGVTVTGGLDLEGCQRDEGNTEDLPVSPKDAYAYFHKDLQCLVDGTKLLNSNYLNADVMDKGGKTVLTVGMAPWRGQSANRATAHAACSNIPFYFEQTCVY